MNKKYTTTDEELIEAVKTSLSFRQVLQKLNIVAAGGNYKTTKTRIERLRLDTSHFTGKVWNAGRKFPEQTKPVEYYLRKDCPSAILSHQLRRKLISSGLKQHACEVCNLSEWQGKPIPLELHHMNGDNKNNELTNLQLLCPNCHAQTETYRGKNIGKSN